MSAGAAPGHKKYHSGFNPLDILGCSLWLDASDESTFTNDVNSILEWRDKVAGEKFTKYSGSPGRSINNRAGNATVNVSFSASLNNTTYVWPTSNYTLFVVGYLSAVNATNYSRLLNGGGAAGDSSLFLGSGASGSGNYATFTGSGGGWNDVTTNSPATSIDRVWSLMGMRVASTVLTPYLNGTAQTTKTGTTAPFTGLNIGGVYTNSGTQTTSQTWNGNVAEIIVYNSALSDSDRQIVEGYLYRKWLRDGIASTITTFNPLSYSNCVLWLDAADTSTFTLSGSNVTQWRDKSTNAYVLTPTGTVTRSSTINSLPVVTTGNQSYLTVPSFAQNFSNYSTYYVMRSTSGLSSTQYNFVFWANTSGMMNVGIWNNGGTYTVIVGRSGAFFATGNLGGSHQNQILLLSEFSGATFPYIFRNGTQLSYITYTGGTVSSLTNDMYVGGIPSNTAAIGFDIAELIVYGTNSLTRREEIEQYLAQKWGLQANLPTSNPGSLVGLTSTHPYYSITPVIREFAPIDITGCCLWLDAMDSSSFTFSGSNIVRWNDKSGNEYHLNQTTTASGPTQSGNYVVFSSDRFLNIPQAALNNLSTYSIFLVINPISANNWIFVKQHNGVNTHNVLSMTYNSGSGGGAQTGTSQYMYWRPYNAGTQANSGTTFSTSTTAIFELVFDGTNILMYRNGTLLSTTSASGTGAIQNQTSASNFTLGAWISSGVFVNSGQTNFQLGEMMFFTSNLSTTQRQEIEGYLAKKWGLLQTSSSSSITTFTPTSISGCSLWLDAIDSSNMTISSSTNGTATLNQYVTTSAQNVSLTGILSPLSNITGGTSVMNGSFIGSDQNANLAPSATAGDWYSYYFDGSYSRVVKIRFALSGSTLTVVGLSAGYNTTNSVTTSNSGATNDSNYATYTSTTIATSAVAAGYGVARFTANFTSSTTVNNITQWNDKSGNGRNTSSLTGTAALLTNSVNGKPGVYFNGTSYFTGSFSYSSNTLSWFVVGTVESDGDTYGRLLSFGTSGEYDYNSALRLNAVYRNSGTALAAYRNNGLIGSGMTITYTTPFLMSSVIDGTNNSPFFNGTAATGAATSGNFGFSSYGISSSIGLNVERNKGYIFEVIVYSAALTANQRQQVEGYLANKWGLSGSLPSTHPYDLTGLTSTHPYISRNPATVVFNPRQVSNCALWLDSADSSTLTLSGSNVTTWNDKSGNGRNFTASGTGATWSSTAPGLVFTTNLYTSSYTAAVTSETIFAVVKYSSTGFFIGSSANGGREVGVYSITQFGIPKTGIEWGPITPVSSVSAGTTYLVTGITSGTSVQIGVNGTTRFSTATLASGFSGGNTQLGREGASSFQFQGTLYEVIAYSSVLSTADRQRVEAYLAWKWGVNIGYTTYFSSNFLPTSLGNCVVWYDGLQSSNFTLSGSNISQWNDRSGNNFHATQATTAKQATYLWATGGVQMTTSSWYNINSTTGATYTRTHSVFIVATRSTAQGYFYGRNPASGGGPAIIAAFSGTSIEYYDSSQRYTFISTPVASRPFIACYTRTQGGNIVGRFNGSTIFTQAQTFDNGITQRWLYLNASQGDTFTDKTNSIVYEFIIYSAALTTAQVQQVEGYLAWKWNITDLLADGHPYKPVGLLPSHPYKLIKP